MGAEAYQYVVEFNEDIQVALDALRKEIFEKGEFNGAEFNPSTPDEALEMSESEGTRSILDIMKISEEPQYHSAAPCRSGELQRYFGTDKPSVEMIENNNEFWGDIERGMARYIITYESDTPKQIFFAGYSFD